ncbi:MULTISPECIES: hypothetical protein [Chromobacteriaceae]|uniref:Uncharacterized protein n=1 Tax=Pseudogulbenkiania ferrooxidans EGD-HP2 TaxID=1388764 RepID=A0ABP2XGT0_9NEIS|nr:MULTISPECIES: hypothetical protein [Chromobacteriaceae]AVG14453.1 hypothetical protein CFN79_00380 [Chromobacterium vaccinii]ERE00083.1 hypothetical protein O166_15735 [Pseudogulbenkiania ferrooxidans EGD-HP2]
MMSPAEARSIVEALAIGVDPLSGELLSQHAVLRQPEVVRALFLASRALEAALRGDEEREDGEAAPAAFVVPSVVAASRRRARALAA